VSDRAAGAVPLPSRLFVYGTLMPGRLRWPLLAPFATGHRPAEAAGHLFDSGQGWPVAVFCAESAAVISGVLVDLEATRLVECLRVIDEVEDTATDELRRVAIVTLAGEPAWAYHATRSSDALTPIVRWDAVPLAEER
jgi:gamma-glutamylcyclotransferase (GGCT)/AIG2-like uncharacterized protein YtfP